MNRRIFFLILFTPASWGFAQLIQPADLQYLGAFRLPEGSGGSDWNYSGTGSAYYPSGDPSGPNDGYTGSIFAIGHDQQQTVSEVSIPVPKISAKKNPADLNTASTLQGFKDIKGNLFGDLEVPRGDLEYMPAMGGQAAGKLHFCWGQHFQFDRVPSHGWCETDLSNPKTAGAWFMGDYTNYITNDYLFEIPEAWAAANVNGRRLATGRFRDGGWAGYGPALLAYNPAADGNPPAKNATLSSVTLLLLYGEHIPGTPEISNSESMKMKFYKDPDEWSGGAWLAAGANGAVVFVGTKAMGRTWYGFSNGVVYPTDGTGPFPPVPPYPHDQRGWWADSIQAQILFYNPADLANVAKGMKKSYEPQPYAVKDLNPYLYDPGYDYYRGKMASLGDCCYDRERNILYVFERLADEDKSLVHVFGIRDSGTGVKEKESGVRGSEFRDRGPEAAGRRSVIDGRRPEISDRDSGDGHRAPGIGNREWGAEDGGSIPHFRLEQNYPNPFNPETTFRFKVAEPGKVVLKVFDVLGKEVAVLVDGMFAAGGHQIGFNALGLSPGIYFYTIQAGERLTVKKMVLTK